MSVCRFRCSCSSCSRTGWAGFNRLAFRTAADAPRRQSTPLLPETPRRVHDLRFTTLALRLADACRLNLTAKYATYFRDEPAIHPFAIGEIPTLANKTPPDGVQGGAAETFA
ncbi:hypothetical protein BN2476_230204 [Paraburkholderia piptadeniae]|uniref:Uncharacterized protein n=1 Tax=Paraburkholderia piptadeniae TaxID=1701573 RepID=A0A1N7RYK4_9BURK|nr:hypothetical protein BN2476_230204 [Paraburkholderia piptadeniae]